MPKIPIDFSLGAYEDNNSRLGNRDVYNCYPETTPGAVNKTILRSVEGYSSIMQAPSSGDFNDAIIVDEVIYFISSNKLYSCSSPYTSSSSIATFTGFYHNGGPTKMVSNGKNIVILAVDQNTGSATTDDFYYDIATNTLATIQSKDADYSSYGKAIDVVFKDGYYLFITETNLFHGDNSATGDGLAFNPLSFSALPSASGSGVGVEVANSAVYVFTKSKTFLYQTAPTTPFSFSRSTGQDIEIGLSSSQSKVSFDDNIFLVANTSSSRPAAKIISGTSVLPAGNDYVDELLANLSGASNDLQISVYEIRGHKMVHCMEQQATSSVSQAFVYDFTESQIKGAPVWHFRAMYDGSGGFSTNKISKYLDISRAATNSRLFAMGTYGSSNVAALYVSDQDESFGNSNVFNLSLSAENGFLYTFPFIRADANPVNMKSVKLRFTEDVTTVTLYVSTDGSSFTSLGEIDLTNVNSKTAEWRRLGRFNEDALFKVLYQTDWALNELNPQLGNKAGSLIEGYFVV